MSDVNSDVIGYERLADELGRPLPDRAEIEALETQAPSALRLIAHYALLWGISDDGYRSNLLACASPDMRRNLRAVVTAYEDRLETWLAGPASQEPVLSRAYIAYTCLVLASDEVGPL